MHTVRCGKGLGFSMCHPLSTLMCSPTQKFLRPLCLGFLMVVIVVQSLSHVQLYLCYQVDCHGIALLVFK